MAVLELYGKCKELGYCDCRGFFGCVDPKPPAPKPVIENELRNAMEAERQTTDYANHNYRRELEVSEDDDRPGLVECEVCDRSHLPNHPHITNIEGDIPLDDEPVQVASELPTIPRELPAWLKDKPGSEAIRPAAGAASADDKLCQVCGKPWAPRHACSGAQAPETDFNRPVAAQRKQTKCESCGLVKRSNHACKGQKQSDPPVEITKPCVYCEASGELCIRHGGLRSDYDTARAGGQIAHELPKPISVAVPAQVQSEKSHNCRKGHPRTPENTYIRSDGRRECKERKRYYHNTGRPALQAEADPELAAIGVILRAIEGLQSNQLKRVMSYVASRLEKAE